MPLEVSPPKLPVCPVSHGIDSVVLYTVFGFLMILVATLRRTRSNIGFFTDGHGRLFRTSGRVVLLTSLLSFSLYICLIVLLLTE